MTRRRALALIVLLALLAVAAWWLMREAGDDERVRFTLYRPGTAQFFLDRGTAPGASLDHAHDVGAVVPFGVRGDIGLACAQADPANRNGLRTFAEGVWFHSQQHAQSRSGEQTLGRAGDLPFCADFDGDGSADNGVFRDGAWSIATKRELRDPDIRFAFGAPGDRPVVLNVKGAGNQADRRNVVYGVYRRGMWYLDTKGTGTVDAAHALGGLPEDVPLLIPRWSRDAGALPAYSLAIFRNGTWIIKPDPDGAQTLVFSFGAAGDLPGVLH